MIEGEETPFEEIFYRPTDRIELQASRVEALGRTWADVPVRLSTLRLDIGEDHFDPEKVPNMVATTDRILIPREAMGFGDVKFLGAIGAFIGWQGAVFSLMASAVIGAFFGISLILMGKREWSAKLPYGPYIAVAALLWVFCGRPLTEWYVRRIGVI